jgi:hypothetical protein
MQARERKRLIIKLYRLWRTAREPMPTSMVIECRSSGRCSCASIPVKGPNTNRALYWTNMQISGQIELSSSVAEGTCDVLTMALRSRAMSLPRMPGLDMVTRMSPTLAARLDPSCASMPALSSSENRISGMIPPSFARTRHTRSCSNRCKSCESACLVSDTV